MFNFLRSKSFFITFITIMVMGVGAAYLIRLGFYPVAVVNSSFVGARTLEEAVVSTRHYFNQLAETYLEPEERDKVSLNQKEIRRAVLDKLVENILVYDALKESAGNDLGALVENRIRGLEVDTGDFKQAVGTLYGLSSSRFRELFLIPQAREEILTSRIEEGEGDFSEWLKARRKRAKVRIIARGLYWNGAEVLIK